MSEFNLIDEPWIWVVTDYKGTRKLVGLREFFQNCHQYLDLAGDMPTQDFAVMRFILAILHTVFSRFDADGKPYEYLEVGEKMRQIENVDEEDAEEYEDSLMETWQRLWEMGKTPEIVIEYLESWYDRFYLFDDEYPFYQVTKEEISGSKISKAKPSETLGKNINRLISESRNKVALFSPKYSSGDNKELLNYDEAARWLVTFQSYASLSDKVRFSNKNYKASKGWLFDLGGVFLSSDNLYKTLVLNMVLVNTSNTNYNINIQKPAWEYKPSDIIKKYMKENEVNNISELYTAYSKAIYISDFDPKSPFKMGIVKLPEVLHRNNFLEPMTLWRYNKDGPNKGNFTPRKHQLNKSLWRSFGLITETEDANEGNENTAKRKPGIIDWLNDINDYIGDETVKIKAISMEDDGNAMSWVPTNEIVDSLCIESNLVNDLDDEGWTFRINKVVDKTKYIVDKIFWPFVNDTKKIRSIDSNDYVTKYTASLYYELDKPFRDWLASIDYEDNKDEKIGLWYKELKIITINQAEKIVAESGPRDFTGIVEGESVINIATAFNIFISRINNEL